MKNAASFLFVFSVAFLLIGVPFTLVGRSLGRQADRLEQLPVLGLAALESSPPGLEAIIEGGVAERNPLQFQTFVVYTRELYEGEDCDDDGCEAIWLEQEQVTPPLWLDLPGGRARIVNSNYYLWNTAAVWESTPERVAYETVRYQGFEINDPIFAVGRVGEPAPEPAFEAEALYSGTRDAQASSDRTSGRIFFGIGLVFSVIGGGLLGALVVSWVR